MSVMLLCPGQGSQQAGMFGKFADNPAADAVLDLASSRLGTDVRQLGEAGNEALDLSDNRVAQILLTAHCLAVKGILGDEIGEIFVGYSVGEIAAAACAGSINPETAFELIDHRARCMDESVAAGGEPQGMLAVIGIRVEDLRELAAGAGTAVAIVNGRDHAVLGGAAGRIDELESNLVRSGAHTVRRLPVRVASHTPLMRDAAAQFRTVLEDIRWTAPRGTLLSGIDGRRIATHADAVTALSQQLCEPLDFSLCLQLAREYGATSALEIGPGERLARLCAEVLPELPVRAVESFRTAAGPEKWLASVA